MSLPHVSTSDLLRQLESGEISSVEATRATLDSIDATDAAVNAFIHVDREAALRQAEAIDAKRHSGMSLGRLAGVPVAVKDVLCTIDFPTTCASRMLGRYRSPYDATVVRRLRAADAVIVGKTNMDEFAMGASTETGAFGACHNPWDTARTAGGSSGGAAACVAAGNVTLSVGTDTGGSIRQPAAFCGVTGMKPTYGRVSRYGLVAFASSLDQAGPLAASVTDAARLLQVIAGYDSADSTSIDAPVPDYLAALDEGIRGMRVGIVREAFEAEGLDPEIRAASLAAADALEAAGAKLVDVHLPHAKYWVPTYYIVAPCEASSNLSRYDGAHYGYRAKPTAELVREQGPLVATYCRSRGEGFGEEVKRRIMIGTYALSSGYYEAYYLKALKVRRLIRGDFDAAFKDVDLLLSPVTPTTAFRLGEKLDDPIQMYLCDLFTVGANLAGLPAISLPAGNSSEGLPIGVQLQAPPLEEARLLRAGAAFQRETDHHLRRPTL